MTTSWLIVLGEFAVFFTCAYWYLHRSRERSFAVRVEHDSIEGMTLGKVRKRCSAAIACIVTGRLSAGYMTAFFPCVRLD